ncbi:MAG: lysophospholipase [Hyphomicrobiales bacterium]
MVVAAALTLAACGPRVQPIGQLIDQPYFDDDAIVLADGVRLPFDEWPAKKPRAVIIGVHGMNGYAADLHIPAPWFAKRGVTVYAYDQRSFGRTDPKKRGIWPGDHALVGDLSAVVDLVNERHKGLPVYVLGLSMGGAVTMLAAKAGADVDGIILVAPAVWGWRAMNPFLRSTLWVTAHVAPGFTPATDNLDVWPSDNIEMLREISRDPNYLKETRTDAIYGLVTLMDKANDSAGRLKVPVLYLYGKNDQIVPSEPSMNVMGRIPQPKRLVIYKNGWHMLLRDKQRERVWKDILTWMDNQKVALPSGEEITDRELAQR